MTVNSVKIDVHRLMYSDDDDEGEENNEIEIIAEDNDSSCPEESEEDLEKRQLSYPPLPVYHSPTILHAKERLGLLTPTEELSEGEHASEQSGRRQSTQTGKGSRKGSQIDEINRKVSFNPSTTEERIIENNNPLLIGGNRLPEVEDDDLIELQSRQELVLNWQEKHLNHPSLSQSGDEIREILDSSEMDSFSLMKSLRSIPPSNFSTMVQEMATSLTTLRSQLSTLNTISLFGDRLRELQPGICDYNLDLLPLIKKLCTLIGESRSPEAAVTLSKLIHGAGPSLITDDLLHIVKSNNMKRKPGAIDGITYGLLTFPRDEFDIEKVADAVSRCLWNSKQRIRQASIECLAVVAHVLGPRIALPFLRETIEQNRPPSTNASPAAAVSARVSRHLLPSLSPVGLIDYGLVLPSKQLSQIYFEQVQTGELEPILSKGEFGADVIWILHGAQSSIESTSGSRSTSSSNSRTQIQRNPNKSGNGFRAEDILGEVNAKFIHQKHRESLGLFEKEDHHNDDRLAEFKLHELERNYQLSIEEADEYVEAKVSPRDRDSGVSSLKSVRVASPTESSSSTKSPPPDVEIPLFPKSSSTPSISSQSDEILEGTQSPFGRRKSVMARTPRPVYNGPLLPSNAPRVLHSPPPANNMPPNLLNSTISTSSSSFTHPGETVPKKPISTRLPARKAKSVVSRENNATFTGRLRPCGSSNSSTLVPATSRYNSSAGGDSPKNITLSQGLMQLASPDWETTVDGFGTLSQLLRLSPEQIRSDLPNVNRAALLHLSNLRTQVTRAACQFFEELFIKLGKPMELDCEKIAEKLFDKTADTNKFIRDASMAALESMVKHLNPSKSIVPLENYGSKHRNSVVRATAAHITRVLVEQLGPERVLHQHANKLLPMIIKFLQEGSLETRTHAKLALSSLVIHGSFEGALKRNVPSNSLRNVEKTISSIKNDLIRKG